MSPAVGAQKRSLGGYDILYAIKIGGMGEVLLGRKLGTGGFEKLVALKTIRSDLRESDQLRTMFLDEARLLGRLNHPAIAAVHDFGEDDGTLYLAMEYVAGVRFSELVRREPPPLISARAMAQACRGLHAAHELADLAGRAMKVVHRDVSPENLMLTFDGRVKVLDFGIALMRGRQAPVTEFGTIKGKPPYLTPEQIKNEPVDRRTDIFAAAVVLHEMITGEQVFCGDSVYAVARSIEHDDVEPPSAIVGELPPGLDDAVMRGLQRNPAERFQTAAEMADALERVCEWASGPSLEAYASGALKQTGEEHRKWLHELVSNAGNRDGELPRGRPSGVMTAQAQQALADEFDLPKGALNQRVPGSQPSAELSVDTDPQAASRERRSKRRAVVALLAGAAIMASAAWLGLRGGMPSNNTGHRATFASDAGVADAARAAHTPAKLVAHLADAGVADAAPVTKIARHKPHPVRVRIKHRRDAGSRRVLVVKRRADAAPPKPKALEYGYVTIAADPFALIRIDGKQIGPTPKFRYRISTGRHQIKLISPDTGKVRLSRSVVIRKDKLEKVIAR